MDSSGQSGQGGRPTSEPTGSTGGSSWQSTPTGGTSGSSWQGGSGQGSGQGSGATPPASSPPAWQSTPEQAPAAGATGWTRPAAGTAAGTAVPGTAGFFYADVPNRVIAYIIDVIILAVIGIVVGILVTAIAGPSVTFVDPNNPFGAYSVNTGAVILSAILSTAVNGIYFVGTWISWRATPGQRVLGMQVGNETDGATLSTNQAITRWILLGAPFGIASALVGLSGLQVIIGLAAVIWIVVLLVTTAQSPTKQGLHDRYAHTVVVKAARAVG